ncbi:MAG: glycosyltransferase family 39 protein [Victivallales bacterium]|nr:glycosyltransferase family 39 protein [Victivallales bacterium]
MSFIKGANIKEFSKQKYKFFPLIIYILCLGISTGILFEARKHGLLGIPLEGMDQRSMLDAAVNLYYGRLPSVYYYYSYVYTVFLYFSILITGGDLVLTRLFQTAVCSLIPVFIYSISLKINVKRVYALLSAFLYCLYAPAILISLSFLRAAPLALCFICFLFFIINAYQSKKLLHYLLSGAFASLCILGRENFIPVVALPLIFLFCKEIRSSIKIKYLTYGVITAFIPLILISLFNYIIYDCFALIPGHISNIISAYHGKAFSSGKSINIIFSILNNIPLQLSNFISSYEIPNSLSVYAHKDIIYLLKYLFVPFNIFIAFAAVSLFYVKYNKYILLFFLSCLCYTATMIFFDMFYRFRIPVVPLLCVLSGITLQYIAGFWKNRKMVSLTSILVIVLIFRFTYVSPGKLRPKGEKLAAIKLLINERRFKEAEQRLSRMDLESNKVKITWKKLILAKKKYQSP